MNAISEGLFREILEERLGNRWERALDIFKKCGVHISFEVTNVLLWAVKVDKVPEVLDELNTHYKEHLVFQHPEIRGLVYRGVENPTDVLFRRIKRDILTLPATP